MLASMWRRPQPDARKNCREVRTSMKAAILCIVLFSAYSIAQTVSRVSLPGSPLPGLTPRELELFRVGLEDFTEVETADEGLGPAFNGASCAVCHSVPAIGGVSSITEVRGGY